MKERFIITKFVELKALGNTNEEIAKKLDASKPTLIKWGKLYKEEIEETRRTLTKKLAEKIAKNNEELIYNLAENLKRALTDEKTADVVRDKYIKKSYKRLGDIFKVSVKSVDLRLNADGDVVGVVINSGE